MRHALSVEPAPPARPLPAETAPAYLDVSGLWKSYGDFVALRDISLSIRKGEFVCFLGPSGCGKTTLLRAIAGLDLQSRGAIVQGGRDISTLPAARRDYGIVFQSYALFPNLTIEQNIAFGLENTGRPRAEIAARVAELLGRLVTPDLFAAWRQLIGTAIDLWEPRFRVRRVSLKGSVDQLRLGQVGLLIEADYRP